MMRKGEERRESHNINEVVRSSISFVDPTSYKQGADIRFGLAPDLPVVKCDRIQLQQVLLNLVQNALVAMNGHTKP